MLFVLPQGLPAQTNASITRLARARDLLRVACDAPLTVADAAREAALSPYHFIRTFKAVFGETPRQVRIEARIEQARRMLALEVASVTDICNAVGFSSLGSFSSLFTRRMGVGPSAYRHKARALIQVAGMLPLQLYPGCFSLMAQFPRSAPSSSRAHCAPGSQESGNDGSQDQAQQHHGQRSGQGPEVLHGGAGLR
jgi:AraC-like DNA-binding protein